MERNGAKQRGCKSAEGALLRHSLADRTSVLSSEESCGVCVRVCVCVDEGMSGLLFQYVRTEQNRSCIDRLIRGLDCIGLECER